MLDWIQTNETLITAGVQLVTAAVWIVYLQIFISSFRRQRRSNILINRIAGNHERAHILVGNMGAEPIYVSAVVVDATAGDHTHTTIVTEDQFDEDTTNDASARSLSKQGPLKSAETRDIGALGDLLDHVLHDAGADWSADRVEDIRVTVVAEGTYDQHLVAGAQSYWVHHGTDRRRFLPKDSQTRQIRSRRNRRALARQLNDALKQEAEAVQRDGTAQATAAV